MNEHFHTNDSTSNHLTLPIIFCIDNHRLPVKENNNNPAENSFIDDEFDITDEEESNNSFIYTLCERLAEQFSFKHIHYGNFNQILLHFDQLKSTIIDSMSTCSGYIIDHFPTSYDDLQKFQSEVQTIFVFFFFDRFFLLKIGRCSVLIYIGEHQTTTKDDELNGIVEKFKAVNKAIYVSQKNQTADLFWMCMFQIDCRMEVDEIYEDLKNDILKHI